MEFNLHKSEEIYSFSLYLFFIFTYIVLVILSFTSFSFWVISIMITLAATFIYLWIMYLLINKYISLYQNQQKEDSYFKPLVKEEMFKEIDFKIKDDVITEIGDLDFSSSFIKEKFLS